MFLKTESFECSGIIITLSKLSILQRIEHLTLMKQQVEQAKSDSSRQVTMEDAVRADAFVMTMSLWHNRSQKTKRSSMDEAVRQIKQKVLTIWSVETISRAENVVCRLSGMYGFVVNDTPDQAGDSGPVEPVSAGKYSTVS